MQPNHPPLPLGLRRHGRASLFSFQARLQGTPRNWTASGCPFLAAYIKAVHPFSEVSLRRDGE
ncbi:rCG55488, isoform CRA_b [Rattus norvegicus]|uniref:RCG55488, isoform CRA_b n=1 Tax=Rattus norvegicus TaxID=10116 RepID=A6JR92_RAT|nr:rCG55488, isoform CRA_b [Rattus norvegicus]